MKVTSYMTAYSNSSVDKSLHQTPIGDSRIIAPLLRELLPGPFVAAFLGLAGSGFTALHKESPFRVVFPMSKGVELIHRA